MDVNTGPEPSESAQNQTVQQIDVSVNVTADATNVPDACWDPGIATQVAVGALLSTFHGATALLNLAVLALLLPVPRAHRWLPTQPLTSPGLGRGGALITATRSVAGVLVAFFAVLEHLDLLAVECVRRSLNCTAMVYGLEMAMNVHFYSMLWVVLGTFCRQRGVLAGFWASWRPAFLAVAAGVLPLLLRPDPHTPKPHSDSSSCSTCREVVGLWGLHSAHDVASLFVETVVPCVTSIALQVFIDRRARDLPLPSSAHDQEIRLQYTMERQQSAAMTVTWLLSDLYKMVTPLLFFFWPLAETDPIYAAVEAALRVPAVAHSLVSPVIDLRFCWEYRLRLSSATPCSKAAIVLLYTHYQGLGHSQARQIGQTSHTGQNGQTSQIGQTGQIGEGGQTDKAAQAIQASSESEEQAVFVINLDTLAKGCSSPQAPSRSPGLNRASQRSSFPSESAPAPIPIQLPVPEKERQPFLVTVHHAPAPIADKRWKTIP